MNLTEGQLDQVSKALEVNRTDPVYSEDVEEPIIPDNTPTVDDTVKAGCSGSLVPTFGALVMLLGTAILLASKKRIVRG